VGIVLVQLRLDLFPDMNRCAEIGFTEVAFDNLVSAFSVWMSAVRSEIRFMINIPFS
jgi:hypothetical protein